MTIDTFSSFRESFFALVKNAENIIITSHYSPDDDSIGSVLSLYQILKNNYQNKNIRIIYTGVPVSRYSVIPYFEHIEWVSDVSEYVKHSDVWVFLDANQYGRFSKQSDILEQVSVSICIDHHASLPDKFSLVLIDPTITSTSELIYRAFDLENNITKDLAQSVLLGILGDTGNFSYVPPSQSGVFLIAKHLVETVGMPIDGFRARYGGIPKRIIPLLQELVKNTTYSNISGWPDGQYSFIDRDVLSMSQYSDEDISAASHIYMGQYLPRVEGYTWGFVITPRTDSTCRMSGRSLPGSVNVRDLHERLGIGGGHDRASGGYFVEIDPSVCILKVLEWMKENKPLLK
jgi:phosphoesterase RecJ-like protein